MKKSNWIIVAILVVASIVFLAMWYALGFNLVDDPLDLVVTIVWWVVIIAVCVLIKWSENKRRRFIRTSFLGSGVIYNPEAGIVRVESEAYVPALQRVLRNLEYSFDEKNVSNDQRIRFTYIVRTDKFADNGNTWVGEVVKVSNPDDVRRFNSKVELEHLVNAA
ncbi:hypothetical protein [Anaerotardibacter muris]|uniref:hypothetical protein n=1 Tax=Anaerotardibacter muris TaxID=2941505 RepID=UPI00203DC999|nr:hypothetical protein [Anaerotardibacter muris]